MKRLKAIVSYDGTNYSGFQTQQNANTVQDEIEKVLQRMHKGEQIKIFGSGRTDANVHAEGQVFHFDSSLDIEIGRWSWAIQTQLPSDISIKSISVVDQDFHARYDVVSKEYRYYIQTSRVLNVFRRNYSYHYPYPIEIERIRVAAKYLEGTHDFTSFCSTKTVLTNKVRTIHSIEIIEHDSELEFRFLGNGFLYNMVRIIIGTLLEVGRGRKNPEDIKKILNSKNRQLAGKTAPGHGLYLWQVNYNN